MTPVNHEYDGTAYEGITTPRPRGEYAGTAYENPDAALLAIGDRLAAAVKAHWTGDGECSCKCCTAAREWIARRLDP